MEQAWFRPKNASKVNAYFMPKCMCQKGMHMEKGLVKMGEKL